MEEQEFYIGQIFDGVYPPMAAVWCNTNNAFIDVIGERRYEIKAVPGPTEEEIKQARIAELKELLTQDDYRVRKCAEYNLLGLEPPYDISEIHERNEAWRAEINELEQQLS